jgi:GR25 family glycosyltransferase involved in LPS biosynthesis
LAPEHRSEVYCELTTARRIGRTLSCGEIGCALSHRRVYQQIVDQRLAAAFVLEDDAVIDPQFRHFYDHSAEISTDIDLLSLHAGYGFVSVRAHYHVSGFSLHRARSNITGTVGYFIRPRAAKIFLATGPKITTVADWPSDHRKIRHYLVVPMPINHSGTDSTLATGREPLQGAAEWSGSRILAIFLAITFIKYVVMPSRYYGFVNYCDREISLRLLRLAPFFYKDVRKFRQPCS